jgi:DNA-3-methyladenine glycosylase II
MTSSSRNQFEIQLEGPIDFAASLEIFRRSGDDLLDRWDGTWLMRTVRLNNEPIAYACRPSGSLDSPTLLVRIEKAGHADAVERAIVESVSRLTPEFNQLARTDPIIGRLAQLHRGFRPLLHPDLMVALVRAISAQQVNLRWAATVRARLAANYGRRHRLGDQWVMSLDPRRLAQLETADIRALQFTTRKAEYVINAARAIAEGILELGQLNQLTDAEVVARITAVRGLGVWTSEWLLARTMGRPRVSAADLGVRKAVGKAYYDGRMPSPDEVRSATDHWGSAAAFAQELLLHAQHNGTLGSPPAPMLRTKPGPRRTSALRRARTGKIPAV